MRCGGGGRASPPAPQGDPAPSCPDAVTKSHRRNCASTAAPAPQSLAEAEPGPSPRAGRGANGRGRVLRLPSALLGFHRRRGDNHHRHHFSLSAFATASPDDSDPTRCCSMRSSSANPYAPDRNHQAPIGCRHRLCLSPPLSRSTQGRAAGREDGNRHLGGRPQKPDP